MKLFARPQAFRSFRNTEEIYPEAPLVCRRGPPNIALILGSVGTALFVIAAIGAPLFAPYDPLATSILERLQGPSLLHVAGTDELGRDTFSRLLFAGRLSLMAASVAVGIGLVVGAAVGMVAGCRPGWVDGLLMRTMDLLFSFPAVLLAIVIMAVLGSSVVNAMIAIGIIFIPGFARYGRSLTRTVMLEQYIAYARSTGIPFGRMLLRDLLPNVAPGLIVQATTALGYAITLEATLSFLGLGAQPPDPSWGNMVGQGRGYMAHAPMMIIAPVLAVLLAVASTNLLGEGLHFRTDTKQSRGGL